MSSNNSGSKGFRPGALVMLLRAKNSDRNVQRAVGTPRKLGSSTTHPEGPGVYWELEPPVFVTYGDPRQVLWNQNAMRLIDPDDSTDEMLAITGLPVSTKPKEPENV